MRDLPENSRLYTLRWLIAGFLLFLVTMRGFVSAIAERPQTLQMIIAGDRWHPARRLHVAMRRAGPAHQKIAEPPTGTISSPDLGAPEPSSQIGVGPGGVIGFSGQLRLRDLNVRWPVGDKTVVVLDRLTVAGYVESRLDRWAPAALRVRQGTLQWAALSYGNQAVYNFEADWRIEDQKLITERCAAQIFGGHVRGSFTWDLATHAMPQCEFQLKSINMHEALANLSPEHLDAEGHASGVLHLVRSPAGELSGSVELTFDEPGLLRIGEVAEVRQMLVGNVGLELANLAMQDLQHYPFKEGRVFLESVGENSQLKINFIRQPEAHTEETPPRKGSLNGQEVQVRSLVVPTIDLTIPIRGTSLAVILSQVSGIHPLIETSREQPGK